MKKYAKIIALILSVFTLCTILCSCDALDEMRSKHALWQEDGTILYNGNTYVKIENYSNLNYELSTSTVYVTKENVPTLLSSKFGSYCRITKDNVIIYGDEGLYVLKEQYDQINEEAQKAINGEFDSCFLFVRDFGVKWEMMLCNSHDVQLINSILNEVTPVSYVGERMQPITLYKSTQSGYFYKHLGSIWYLTEGSYVIETTTENNNEMRAYIVPEKHKKDMQNIYLRCGYKIFD